MPAYEVSVEKKPAMHGLHTVTEVSEVKEFQNGSSNYVIIKFGGLENTPDARKMVAFTPRMFTSPGEIAEEVGAILQGQSFEKVRFDKDFWGGLDDDAKKVVGEFGNLLDNVAKVKGKKVSFLQGLIGENYDAFLEAVDASQAGGPDPDAIGALIGQYADGAQVISYMVQQSEKNSDGTRELTDFYEIKNVQPATEKTIERLTESARKEAEKDEPKFVVGWEV